MKNKKKLKKRIMEEDDFIYCPRLGNSLSKLLDKYPEGVENDRIQKILLLSEKEVSEIYESAIKKLRDSFDEE